MYDKKKIQKILTQLITNESKLNELLEEIINPKQFKEGYFDGIRKFIDTTYQQIKQEDEEALDEFHEMISEIGEGEEMPIDNLKIPKRIKKESKILEQLLNFYITFTGGLTANRGDSFYIRFFKPLLIQTIQNEIVSKISKNSSKKLYDIQQQYYLQNLQYYAKTHKNIRKGNSQEIQEKRKIEAETSSFTFELNKQENTLILLQDINPKLCKLYLKNTHLLKQFQKQFGEKISIMIKQNKTEFIKNFYTPFFEKCENKEHILSLLTNAITNQELMRLKDHLYTFDYRLLESFISKIYTKNLNKEYNELALLNIIATSKENLLGVVLRYYFMDQQNSQEKTPIDLSAFFHLLILEIFGIDAKQ